MSKNIYNQAPSSTKNIFNESRILAKNVKYNNLVSGLPATNVQDAIDELSSFTNPAEPFQEGIVFGKTLNDTVSLGENGNNNNFSNNVTIGNNSAKSVLSYSNNTVVGNRALQNYTQSAISNNTIIGNNLFNNTVDINAFSDNIVLGNNITSSTGVDVENNILLGRNIVTNTNDSLIINTGTNDYNSDFNNIFYLGDSINQPTEDNNFFIDNKYSKYIIKDIPSPATNVYYFNYSVTAKNKDGSNTVDPRTSNGPFPIDTFSTYADLSQGPTIFPEVQFSVLINTAKLLTDYAYITTYNNPNLTTFPAGNWNIKLFASTDINGSQITPRFYKYNNGVETFLFNGNTVPVFSGGIQTINIPTSQAAFPVSKDDRLVVKLFAQPTVAGPFPTLTFYLEGFNPWTLTTPFVNPPYITNFILHYDAITGNVTKQVISNVSDSPSSVKVLKKSNDGGNLFRNFTGNNGIIVSQLTDDIDISLVDKQPTTLGGSYGLNLAASGSEMTGRNSFNNYTSGVNINAVTSIGNNHFTLNTSAVFSNSMFFGSTIRFNSLLNMSNSLIASNIINNTGVTSIQNSAIIMPKTSSLTIAGGVTSLTGSTLITSSDISLTTDPNYSVVLASGSTINPGSNNMVLNSGGSNSLITMKGLGNMLFQASGSSTNYTSANFNNGVIFNSGSTTVAATANSQFNACHTTLRMPNLLPIGTNQNSNNIRLMGYDTTTGLISPYLTNTFSRVYRQQANTNAAGVVIFNTGLTVANIAGTTYHAQVINSSLTVAYTCQTTSVTASTVTIQVFQSTNAVIGGPTMVPAPANIVVSFSMNY